MYDSYFNTVCAFLVLQVLFVVGRVYVRAAVVRAFGWDDVAAIVTLLLSCGYDATFLGTYVMSDGPKELTLIRPVKNIWPTIHLLYSSEMLYITATSALKVALGMLLLRVLVKKWMRWTIWVVMGISVSYGIIYFFIILFQCGNPETFARKIILHQCLSPATINGTSYVHGVLTALADLIFASLPVFFLWNANFSARAKYSVGGILMLGSVGCICTFVRIGWIHFLVEPTLSYLITARAIGCLSALELSIGLICISLATYKPLYLWILGRPQSYDYYNETTRHTNVSHTAPHELDSARAQDSRQSIREGQPSPQAFSTQTGNKSWGKESTFFETASESSDNDRGPYAV